MPVDARTAELAGDMPSRALAVGIRGGGSNGCHTDRVTARPLVAIARAQHQGGVAAAPDRCELHGHELNGCDLTVVVPAFNEEARLPALLGSLQRSVDPAATELIIVDDGSTDATVRVARELGGWAPLLRVIEHGTNRGKGAAVRTGVQAAQGRLIAFVDADDATDLEALDPMCERIAGPVGAVFGSRHAPGSQVTGSPPIRGLMGRVFNHVVRFAAGTDISDTQCGAKVFWAPAARAVFSGSQIDGFAFDVEVVRRLIALEVDVIEFPVRWRYVSGTKVGLLTPLRMLADITKLRLRSGPFDLPAIEVDWAGAAVGVAEPLRPGDELPEGAAVRVLIPDGAAGRQAVSSALAEAGAQLRT